MQIRLTSVSVSRCHSRSHSEIPYKVSWDTYTDRALIPADQIVFTPDSGERGDATNIVLVITDGKTLKGSKPFNVAVPPLRVRVRW